MLNSEEMADDRLVDLAGDPRQRGAAQGRAHQGQMPGCWDSLLTLGLTPQCLPRWIRRGLARGIMGGVGRFYLARHGAVLAAQAGGGFLDYLDGLAEGLGESAATLYGFNALEIESSHLQFTMGCTSLAFRPEQSADRGPLLAYNHDFPVAFGPHVVVRRSDPVARAGAAALMSERTGARHRSLSVGYPPLIGAIAGVNERGLGLSVNQAFALDLDRRRPGLFVSTLAQDCLDRCANVGEAIELLRSAPVANGAIVTLVDEQGCRAAVELSGRLTRVRDHHETEVLASFNKYRHPELIAREVPLGAVTTGIWAGYDVHECNLTRQRRFDELVRHEHRHTHVDINRLLADHDGGPGDPNTICRHQDPLDETILTAIIEPQQRAMEISFGKACAASYRRYELDQRSARRSAGAGGVLRPRRAARGATHGGADVFGAVDRAAIC